MTRPASRLPFVDLIKAVASQLIVLHHLAFYGPMSDVAAVLAPALFEWLARDARLAVQAFLVVGGFLAARSLAPQGRLTVDTSLPALAWQRYVRLALPMLVVLSIAMLTAAFARTQFDHDLLPAAPTPAQVLAHVFLLQDLVGHAALSAGVWYVAIDFQLFLLFAALMQVSRWRVVRRHLPPPLLVALLAVLSMFGFNRDPAWDVAAPYFFGSYALGAFAWWGAQRGRASWLVLMLAMATLALLVDFRDRLALAAVLAVALSLTQRHASLAGWTSHRVLAYLSRISYSVFLIHFPVCMAVTAIVWPNLPADPVVQGAGVLLAWLGSVAAGAAFHHGFESRLGTLAWPRLRPA
ncbi:acyltransferase family protein [Niveibacterium microcysteis]|uniref:Acyltransferase n=1 Tax=Niveibacterium microcysteis TaxID=2811415 RepID=A0ABX7M6M8_9RHOO|nr:acyltransferase [Niveibacterium microcysteis]QSI77400.1 acyltransferase [Niveibacterium microcysteis]